MPHYSDGDKAQLGDVVTGFDTKDSSLITGHVVEIVTEDDERVNILVMFVREHFFEGAWSPAHDAVMLHRGPGGDLRFFQAGADYFKAKTFKLACRKDGSVPLAGSIGFN